MSEPFTKAEQDRLVQDQRKGMVGLDDPARWVATLLRVEIDNHDTACRLRDAWEELKDWKVALAEMTRERDACLRVCVALIGDREFASTGETMREAVPFDEDLRDYWETYVRELAKELPDSQPSGNSGGFAAAAGILKDMWDGEPSEDAIRRLRDGTPREDLDAANA